MLSNNLTVTSSNALGAFAGLYFVSTYRQFGRIGFVSFAYALVTKNLDIFILLKLKKSSGNLYNRYTHFKIRAFLLM